MEGGAAAYSPISTPPPSPGPRADKYKSAALVIGGAGLFLAAFSGSYRYALVALSLCAVGLVFAKYLSDWLLAKDDGTPEMRAVSEPIREGAAAFLAVQYTAIAQLAGVVAGIIFLSYQMRPLGMEGGVNTLSSIVLGVVGAVSPARMGG